MGTFLKDGLIENKINGRLLMVEKALKTDQGSKIVNPKIKDSDSGEPITDVSTV